MNRFNGHHANSAYMIELKYLKLIETVAETGTLTKAGEKLFLTQSTLSHQLKCMEDALGVAVFLRVKKRLLLTDTGLLLLNTARNISKELEAVRQEIRKRTHGESGRIRICTECYTTYHWLPAVIKTFNLSYPNIEVVINTENPVKPLQLLTEGKVDIVLVFRRTKDENIAYTEIFNDELNAVVSRDHAWAEKEYVVPSDFKNETLILHHRNHQHSFLFESVFAKAQVAPKKVIHLPLTEANIEMVRAGLGVTVMNSWILKNYRNSKDLSFIPVTKKGLYRKWYLATLRNRDKTDYMAAFSELVISEVRNSGR
jgi:LysR family transcriptional regulator, regulator for metE and metH